MRDYPEDTPIPARQSNPNAVSIRIQAKSMTRAKGQRRHDFRIGRQPEYVDAQRIHLNRPLIALRPLPRIQEENATLRKKAGRIRAMKSNAAVVTSGIITFGHLAAKHFAELTSDQQDAAFTDLAQEIAAKLNTRLEALVIHLDEATIHAHFTLRAYDNAGNAVSDMTKAKDLGGLQDLGAQVMQRHHPKIERGHRKQERLAAGASYPETLHRNVRQLHEDLPREIEAREARCRTLQAEADSLAASAEKTRSYLERLTAKEALNAKEVVRLQTYATRILKKQKEVAELEENLRQEQERLRSAQSLLAQNQERLRSDEIRLVFAKKEVAKVRADAIKALEYAAGREAKASDVLAAAKAAKTEFEAGIAAVESVVGEIFDGTMRFDEDRKKLMMKDTSRLKAAPTPVRSRLYAAAVRWVRKIQEVQAKEGVLDKLVEKVRDWLGRDDLTKQAQKDGEDLIQDLDAGM